MLDSSGRSCSTASRQLRGKAARVEIGKRTSDRWCRCYLKMMWLECVAACLLMNFGKRACPLPAFDNFLNHTHFPDFQPIPLFLLIDARIVFVRAQSAFSATRLTKTSPRCQTSATTATRVCHMLCSVLRMSDICSPPAPHMRTSPSRMLELRRLWPYLELLPPWPMQTAARLPGIV